jgi:hypothetical protein
LENRKRYLNNILSQVAEQEKEVLVKSLQSIYELMKPGMVKD